MTDFQQECIVYAMVATLILVALVATLCRYAHYGDQDEDRGFFYTQPPLGGDHE